MLAATHRSTSYQHVTSTRVTRGPQGYLSTPFLFAIYKDDWNNDGISSNEYSRDALRFTGEQAHRVDYKEKLDDVLFFHSSSLRNMLQGQARPEKYVLVPNYVTVIPTEVELRRPIYEVPGTAHPRTMERKRRERSPMERKSGCRTSSSRTRRASNTCCTDRRFCDRTHGPYSAKFLGVPRKISSYSGKYSRNKSLEP